MRASWRENFCFEVLVGVSLIGWIESSLKAGLSRSSSREIMGREDHVDFGSIFALLSEERPSEFLPQRR